MAAAPAGDRGLDVLPMPLQGAFAFGAAPAAEVLAGLQHPAQPQLTQGFAADTKQLTDLSCADPHPLRVVVTWVQARRTSTDSKFGVANG
jgi:hypothetical protein